jgi:tryptophan synthase alpha chain
MSRIPATFERLRRAGEAALVPYLTAGYPSPSLTRELVPLLARHGADLIELGVPFSDPIADGATIQRASHAALEAGVSLDDCLDIAAEARARTDVPLVFMSYYNPIHSYGPGRFAAACARAGVDGLIVPDLPPEEAGDLQAVCRGADVDLIFLVAPTSTDERLRLIAGMASGFIYCVSLAGVTGARSQLGEGVGALVERVRRYTNLPIVVGFGISTPEHVSQVSRSADGAVVGSALINRIEALGGNEEEVLAGAAAYISGMKAAARPQTAQPPRAEAGAIAAAASSGDFIPIAHSD